MNEKNLRLDSRLSRWGGGRLSQKLSPLIAFKHVHRKFADQFASGESIQLATFEHYTRGEGDRVDPLEGRAINRQRDRHLLHRAQMGDVKAGIFMDRLVGPNWQELNPLTFLIHDNEIHYVQTPAYIFCASSQPDLRRLDCDERIFVIHDLVEFGYQLMSISGGILKGAGVGPVVYEKRDVDPAIEGMREGDPFRKDERFKNEHEVRLVFEPGPIPRDPIQLTMPFALNLITEIFGTFVDRGAAAHVIAKPFG